MKAKASKKVRANKKIIEQVRKMSLEGGSMSQFVALMNLHISIGWWLYIAFDSR